MPTYTTSSKARPRLQVAPPRRHQTKRPQQRRQIPALANPFAAGGPTRRGATTSEQLARDEASRIGSSDGSQARGAQAGRGLTSRRELDVRSRRPWRGRRRPELGGAPRKTTCMTASICVRSALGRSGRTSTPSKQNLATELGAGAETRSSAYRCSWWREALLRARECCCTGGTRQQRGS